MEHSKTNKITRRQTGQDLELEDEIIAKNTHFWWRKIDIETKLQLSSNNLVEILTEIEMTRSGWGACKSVAKHWMGQLSDEIGEYSSVPYKAG